MSMKIITLFVSTQKTLNELLYKYEKKKTVKTQKETNYKFVEHRKNKIEQKKQK